MLLDALITLSSIKGDICDLAEQSAYWKKYLFFVLLPFFLLFLNQFIFFLLFSILLISFYTSIATSSDF